MDQLCDLILVSLAEDEDLQEVEIVTLKQHIMDKVFDQAFKILSSKHPNVLENEVLGKRKLDLIIKKILSTSTFFCAPFIKRKGNKLTIYYDIHEITQSNALDVALSVIEHIPTSDGTVLIGTPKLFKVSNSPSNRIDDNMWSIKN